MIGLQTHLTEDEKFSLDLSKHLGISLGDVDNMPYSDFIMWYKYSLEKPFNSTEIMLAQLTALTYNIHSKKPKSTMDFLVSMPESKKEEIRMETMHKGLFIDIDKLQRNG